MQTITNLCKAFVGESQARNRYTMYASVARKEGYEQISAIFLETAEQEREHASLVYKLLSKLKKEANLTKPIEVQTEVEIEYGTTIQHLHSAIAGENYEKDVMYMDFAKVAEKEGFPEIAKKLRLIAVAERMHSERYAKILKELENNSFFKKEVNTEWVCRQCGYVHNGKEPPEECPLCGHAKSFYQKKLIEF